MNRSAAVLMPMSALPGNDGIGDMGSSAYKFIDIISNMGFKGWQVLPLNPLGFGNSPYQSYSSFAGEPLYISLELLGLNNEPNHSSAVDYEQVAINKDRHLRTIFKNYIFDEQFDQFVKDNEWASNYALYMTLKQQNDMQCWNRWSDMEKDFNYMKDNSDILNQAEIKYQLFLQYIFYKQWNDLKEYANNQGIKIIGDIPIYVSIDSQDVYEHKHYFDLNQGGIPNNVAGVPPDYFSKTGQRWGNPLYNWETLAEDKYQFWKDRLTATFKMYDYVRIDHFRGFDSYWTIPEISETAEQGMWQFPNAYHFFDEILNKFDKEKIIVEDLGDLRPEVHSLRDHYNFMGMKIIQFTLDPKENNNNFNDRENLVVYTGTHDNQTLKGFIKELSEDDQLSLSKHYGDDLSSGIIKEMFNSIPNLAIIPTQDILGLDDQARFNTPGTVGSPNWEWKLTDLNNLEKHIVEYREIINTSKR